MSSLMLAVSFVAVEPAAAVLAVKGFDPVELVAGKEVKGASEHSIVRHQYRYLFSSAANKEKFSADPTAYSIQFGGACMNMGPLSGNCNSERFAVHAGRIYAFASDGCKASFLRAPENYLDREDPTPAGTADESARAKVLLDKAVAAVGGADVLAKCKSVAVEYAYEEKSGKNSYKYGIENVVQFPEAMTNAFIYEGRRSGWSLGGDSGRKSLKPDEPAAEESVKRYMIRQYYREPIALLKAWSDGRLKTAFAKRSMKVDGKPVEEVVAFIAGAATTLSIDPDNGRVLEASFKDRGPTSGGISAQVRTFSDFRKAGGLELPHAVAFAANGKPVENPKITIAKVTVE